MKTTKALILVFLLLGYLTPSQAQKLNDRLVEGNKVEAIISINETHQYEIQLNKGQFGLINLNQNGIDVKIITFSPDGKQLEEFDTLNGSSGNELVVVDAKQAGKYILKIVPLREKKREKKGVYIIELLAISDDIISHLDKSFELIGNRNALPGFFISILDDEKVLYSKGKGYANLSEQIPYTENTIQQIESISKTFIGLSMMLLVEQGKLDLDKDINTYLPFKMSNPRFPNTPITLRQLATHTASIADNKKSGGGYRIENKEVFLQNRDNYMHQSIRKELENMLGKEEISMEDFLKAYFIPKRKYYTKKNFLKREPGKAWLYSNIGATLAAYIVEIVSGQSYAEFVTQHIITPLELEDTTWGYNPEKHAMNALKYDGGRMEYPRGTGATYPTGNIYASSADLSQYLIQWIKGYAGTSTLLKATSYQEIMKINFEETNGQFKGIKNGLFWWIFKGNRMGHNGGDFGSNANMFFYPEHGVGYTSLENMMLNESDKATDQSLEIKKILERYTAYFSSKE